MIANIARFVETEARVYRHRKYCYGYILCLVLNLANVVFNIILLDIFLGGDFLYLGARYNDSGLHRNATTLDTADIILALLAIYSNRVDII